MTLLYLTADRIGTPSGGGAVTFHESEVLKSLGDVRVVSRSEMELSQAAAPLAPALDVEPWKWDALAYHQFGGDMKLAHVYAGTFGNCVTKLKAFGAKVTYTAAAHDIAASRREHEKLGIKFDYPHLNDPHLWDRYVRGYLLANVIVCPSRHSADVMRNFGYSGRIDVIPHGVHLPPDPPRPPPTRFTVGYLGAVGPDKGLAYLLMAWKKLNYPDADLVIAGGHSRSEFVHRLVQAFGGGNISLAGWVENVSDFYNAISLYVQPSVTEGFGIEVLEAMAHGRPVLCSTGAGAADVVHDSWKSPPADPDALAGKIDETRKQISGLSPVWESGTNPWVERARYYSWDEIREKYRRLWRELL